MLKTTRCDHIHSLSYYLSLQETHRYKLLIFGHISQSLICSFANKVLQGVWLPRKCGKMLSPVISELTLMSLCLQLKSIYLLIQTVKCFSYATSYESEEKYLRSIATYNRHIGSEPLYNLLLNINYKKNPIR